MKISSMGAEFTFLFNNHLTRFNKVLKTSCWENKYHVLKLL